MVVLSTASPYKFPAAVLSALEEGSQADEWAQMARLNQLTGVAIPRNLQGLQQRAERHTDVIPKDQMLSYVTEL